jgi:outer membrane protein TolC
MQSKWLTIFSLSIPLLVVVGLSAASAQRENLRTLLDQSVRQYPLLKARAAEVGSANQDVKTSTSEYIPRLSVQHQYTYSTNNSVTGSFYPNGGTVISPSGGIRAANIYDGTFGSFTSALLEWNVVNFGKVATNVKAARLNEATAQAAYDNEIFQHQIRVADAYLLLLISEKLKTIQQSNLERAEGFREVVNAGVHSGLRPGVDSALAQAEYTKAKLLLLESERNQQTQAYRLMELTGALTDGGMTIDSLNFYTALPVGASPAINTQSNPILRYYQTRMQATRARSTAIGRSFLPSISLVAAGWARGSGVSNVDDVSHADFSTGTKYQVYNYLVGISTRWTLTDYVPLRHRYKSEQFKARRDEELYNEQSLRVQRQWKESDVQYQVALEQARTAPVQLEAARQAYDQASARYTSGLTDLPTLLQSIVTLNRAEADVAIAYSNAWRSWLMVAAAQGDISLFLNSVQN